MSITLETPCMKCDGSGKLECCECNQSRDCPDCDGEGYISRAFSESVIPEKHKNREELLKLQSDSDRCRAAHSKLMELNPRAKESYDNQLSETLAKINEQVKALL